VSNLAPGLLNIRIKVIDIVNASAAVHSKAAPVQVRCVFRRNYGSLTIDGPLSETSRWRAIARVLRSPLDAIGSALLPAPCALCGSPLPQLSSIPICDACWTEISGHQGFVCQRCGDTLDQPPVEGITSTSLCRTCRLALPPFVRAVSFGTYEGRMRAAIHALKYERIHPAARRLGSMLAAAIAQLAPETPSGLLVIPVPLHRTKHKQRGFNQARALAVYAIDVLRKSNPEWHLTLAPTTLMRLRSTESQAGLTPRQRRQNVRGAFKVSDPGAVAGKGVLLVDDILTTGATARAASQSLLRAGAAAVYVATLARVRRFNFNNAQAHSFGPGLAQPGIEPANQFAGMHSSSSTHQLP
jgi:ComF family protein